MSEPTGLQYDGYTNRFVPFSVSYPFHSDKNLPWERSYSAFFLCLLYMKKETRRNHYLSSDSPYFRLLRRISACFFADETWNALSQSKKRESAAPVPAAFSVFFFHPCVLFPGFSQTIHDPYPELSESVYHISHNHVGHHIHNNRSHHKAA